MKQKISLLSLLLLSFFSFACDSSSVVDVADEESKIELDGEKVLSKKQIDKVIQSKIDEANATSTEAFSLADLDTEELWSAIVHGNKTVSIGYLAPHMDGEIDQLGDENLDSGDWKSAKSEMLQLLDNTGSTFLEELKSIPVFYAKLNDRKSFDQIRNNPLVKFISPVEFEVEASKTTPNKLLANPGCGTVSFPREYEESPPYRYTSNGQKYPFTFDFTSIDKAWTAVKGKNITIAIIGTGVDLANPAFGADFNYSYGSRTIRRFSTSSGHSHGGDDCGHGTKLASISSGSGKNPGLIGVAPESNLIAVSTNDNVYISYKEAANYARGIEWAIQNGASVVAMANGRLTAPSDIYWMIKAHANRSDNRVIFVAAAGTSPFPNAGRRVNIFPSTMNETISVTGSDWKGTNPCANCHFHSGVEFAMPVVWNSWDELGMPTTGIGPTQGLESFRGSSGSTASLAGVIALSQEKWGKESLGDTRARLKRAAQRQTKKHGLGYGMIDVAQLVGVRSEEFGTQLEGPSNLRAGGWATFTARSTATHNDHIFGDISHLYRTYSWSYRVLPSQDWIPVSGNQERVSIQFPHNATDDLEVRVGISINNITRYATNRTVLISEAWIEGPNQLRLGQYSIFNARYSGSETPSYKWRRRIDNGSWSHVLSYNRNYGMSMPTDARNFMDVECEVRYGGTINKVEKRVYVDRN